MRRLRARGWIECLCHVRIINLWRVGWTGSQKPILLLEMLQPDRSIDFGNTIRATHGVCKDSCLVANHLVTQRQSLALMVFGPIRDGSFNVRKLAFRPLDGRPTAIVGVKVLFLVPKDF